MHSQYLAQGWEEIKQMKAELWMYFQDADQQLQNLKRRRAELELNIAQNMVVQVKVRRLQVKNRREGSSCCGLYCSNSCYMHVLYRIANIF